VKGLVGALQHPHRSLLAGRIIAAILRCNGSCPEVKGEAEQRHPDSAAVPPLGRIGGGEALSGSPEVQARQIHFTLRSPPPAIQAMPGQLIDRHNPVDGRLPGDRRSWMPKLMPLNPSRRMALHLIALRNSGFNLDEGLQVGGGSKCCSNQGPELGLFARPGGSLGVPPPHAAGLAAASGRSTAAR